VDRLRGRLDPEARFGLRFTLLAVSVLLVAVPFGLLLEQVTDKGPFTRVDTSAANHLHRWVHGRPWLVTLLRIVTSLGATWWLTIVVAAAGVALLRAHRVRPAVFLIATGVTGGLLNQIVKALVGRPRPSLLEPVATASGKSFPSGHTMGATVVYGALLVVFVPGMTTQVRRVVIAAAVVLVAAIGFSRLALGVHYISDVLAGFALALAWLAAATAAFRIWRTERVEEGEPP
jgi:undecaprenyl-diphosphatase